MVVNITDQEGFPPIEKSFYINPGEEETVYFDWSTLLEGTAEITINYHPSHQNIDEGDWTPENSGSTTLKIKVTESNGNSGSSPGFEFIIILLSIIFLILQKKRKKKN